MSLDPKKTQGGERKLPEQGNQPARNYAIIDLGRQYDIFQGVKKEIPTNKVMLCWEMTKFMHAFKEGEEKKPLTVMQEYTFTAGDRAKLPKILKTWGKLTKMPTTINLKPYLGKYCSLSIEHVEGKTDGKTYANIAHKGLGVGPFDGTEKPKPFFKDIYFDLDAFSWEQFAQLPARAQKRIEAGADFDKILAKYPKPIDQGASQTSKPQDDPFSGGDTDGPDF